LRVTCSLASRCLRPGRRWTGLGQVAQSRRHPFRSEAGGCGPGQEYAHEPRQLLGGAVVDVVRSPEMTASSPSGASRAAASAHGRGTTGSKAPRTTRTGTEVPGSLASIGSRNEARKVAATRPGPASRTSRTRMDACRGSSRGTSFSHRHSCHDAVRAVGSVVGPARTSALTRS
jgi:hypothetical protein